MNPSSVIALRSPDPDTGTSTHCSSSIRTSSRSSIADRNAPSCSIVAATSLSVKSSL